MRREVSPKATGDVPRPKGWESVAETGDVPRPKGWESVAETGEGVLFFPA